MKLAIVLAISLIVIGCKDKIKGGYCVGKEYSPEHYESVAHSHMIGKVITTYYTRQKVKSKFKVGLQICIKYKLLMWIHFPTISTKKANIT